MAFFLLLYSTNKGQTQKITNFIANDLQQRGHQVHVFNSSEIPISLSPDSYDATIIGAPVYKGEFSQDLQRWVSSHAKVLAKKPSAFFSVCLGILQNDPSVQKQERTIVENFFRATHWQPKTWTIFAGALPYSQYKWLLRMFMRRIAKKAGGDTDTSRDYEYTDWSKVRQFAENFLIEISSIGEEYGI